MEDRILSLAEARGAKAEVYSSDENRITVEFRANEFHSQESRLERGYGLRVVKDGRVGFSSSSDPDKVGELVQAAFDTAEFGKRCGFEFPGPTRLGIRSETLGDFRSCPAPAVKTFGTGSSRCRL